MEVSRKWGSTSGVLWPSINPDRKTAATTSKGNNQMIVLSCAWRYARLCVIVRSPRYRKQPTTANPSRRKVGRYPCDGVSQRLCWDPLRKTSTSLFIRDSETRGLLLGALRVRALSSGVPDLGFRVYSYESPIEPLGSFKGSFKGSIGFYEGLGFIIGLQ